MPRITANFGEANTGASVFYRILNSDGTSSVARTSTGVSEMVAGSGVYSVEVTDAAIAGKTVVWDINSTTKVASQTFPAATLAAGSVNSTSVDASAVNEIVGAITFPTTPDAATVAAAVRTNLAVELDRIDVATSTRSTYAGGDTSGVTTLLGRLTDPRATNLDNLDAPVSSRLATSGYTAPPTVSEIASEVWGYTVETGLTAIQTMRGLASVGFGLLSGVLTNALKFRDIANTKDRISATQTSDGRTVVTLDLD